MTVYRTIWRQATRSIKCYFKGASTIRELIEGINYELEEKYIADGINLIFEEAKS